MKPISFLKFCQLLGIQLRPGQMVIAKVAFDKMSPHELPPDEQSLAHKIFGPSVQDIPPSARSVVAAVCGARAGKTYVLGALRMLHLALTVDISHLANGEVGVAPLVAPNISLAKQPLRFVKGAVAQHARLKQMVLSETEESVVIDRGQGRKVAIECLAATRGGTSLRGRSLVGGLLDEAAFFRDESYQVNDVELFKALSPRIVPGGQLIIPSTPWAKSGLLYELYTQNFDRPTTCIAVKAATLLLRDEPYIHDIVNRERLRDPDNARREYDAEFMDSGTNAFFDSRAIDNSVDESLELGRAPTKGSQVIAACDLGFVSDSSALVIVEVLGGVYRVIDIIEKKPTEDNPLKPSEVIREFAAIAKKHKAYGVMADNHYRETVREYLEEAGLPLLRAPDGASGKSTSYTRAKTLFKEGRVRLPSHEKLCKQLRDVTFRPTSGGGVSVSSPRGPGGHGDIVSALVLALWQGHGEEYSDVITEEIDACEEWRMRNAGIQKEWWES